MSEIETRSVELRADAESGTVEGIAVPWGQRTQIGGAYTEMFERGSIADSGDIKLFYQHSEPIGKVIKTEDREEGFWIRAQISDTAQGRDARTLLRDGVIDRFSVGFIPTESRTDDDGTVIRTAVDLREVSAVVFPAYAGATITQAREAATTIKEHTMADQPGNSADLAEFRETLETIERRLDVINTQTAPVEAPVADTRSAGEIVKALASGDSETAEMVNRAYAGGQLSDSVVRPQFIGDLTRLVYNASPLRSVFGTAALPSEGTTLEYAKLKSNTTQVATQANEGDDLVYGKVQIDTAHADVKTFGGYSELSRQVIERSSVNILNHTLNAQANAAAAYLDANFRAEYTAEVAAQTTAGNTVVLDVTSADYMKWLDGIIDAAALFQDKGQTLDGLIVDRAAFKAVAHLVGADGRPLFSLNGGGQAINTIGTLNLTGITGQIAGVTVILDPKLTGNVAFFNRSALTEYRSPLVRLQDDNVINLTRDFSVYGYVAVAHEEPGSLVPVKKTASA